MKQQTDSSSKKRIRKMFLGIVMMTIAAMLFIMNEHPRVKQSLFTFSYGEAIPTNSDAYLSYGAHYKDVEFDPQLFAMKDIGTYDVEVEFEQERFQLRIAIVDDQPPVITFSDQNQITIYKYNQHIVMNDFWEVQDESDVTLEVEPAPNEIKSGKQEICVIAKDKYANTATACQSVTVKKETLELPKLPDVQTVQQLVNEFIRQKQLSSNSFAFFYYSVGDEESFLYNENRLINAASTIKVPLNMLYEDAYAQGSRKGEDTLVLIKSDMEEGGGDTLKKHHIGEAISYMYLQKQSIENSDNTATNMLVRGLGGFGEFRDQLAQYSTKTLPREFYTQNVVTMNYMSDVMKKLFQDQKKYAKVISYMKNAAVGCFLQSSTDVFEIAQKYGQFADNLHAVGIVYTPQPYLVGIYTMNRSDGDAIIRELNQWLIAYQLMKEPMD